MLATWWPRSRSSMGPTLDPPIIGDGIVPGAVTVHGQAGCKAGAGRDADRRGRIGGGETAAACGQPVQRRCADYRVPGIAGNLTVVFVGHDDEQVLRRGAIGAPSGYESIVQASPGSGSELCPLPDREDCRLDSGPPHRQLWPPPHRGAPWQSSVHDAGAHSRYGSRVDDGVMGDDRAPKPDDGPGHMLSRRISANGKKKPPRCSCRALAVMGGRGKRQALAPWHKRATANAKRLR